MAVISASGRQALIDYKYQSVMKSWLDTKIMTPYWEYMVTFCPLNIHPNVLTFAATIQFLICSFIFSMYCSDLEKCVDSWLYFMIALSLFIYQTLDAIDGKQARRTQQSSPLGQLFDHGNDALTTTPMLITGFCATQFGRTWSLITILMMAYGVFFMLNWRARHVGMMHFGVFSVTEVQIFAIGIFLATAIFGCEIWDQSVQIIVASFLFFVGLWTIYGEYVAVNAYYAKHKNKNDPGGIYELLHMALFVIGSVCWNLCGVLEEYPWAYCWIIGFIFCGIIHRLIVADVTHMKTTKYYHLLDALFVMIVGSLIEYFMNVKRENSIMCSPYMVYGIFIYVLLFWSSYVLKVINEICETLDIKLFVIKPSKKRQ